MPVIAPRMGSLATLLAVQEDWLYEPGDVDDAVRRAHRLLGQMEHDRQALRPAALAVADQAPSWDEMAAEAMALTELTGRA